MAISKFSNFKISSPPSTINPELELGTVSTLQNRYDQGFIALTSEIDRYNNLEVFKDSDKQFVNQKINELTSSLNDYGNLKLDDPKVVANLTLKARSLMEDPTMVKIISNNANYKSLVSRYKNLMEDPKKMEYYNPLNHRRDMEIARKWMSGEIDDMPISSPTMYYDYNKTGNKIAKDIKANVTSTVENGYIYKNTLKTFSDIQNTVGETLQSDPRFMQQTEIEAEALLANQDVASIYANEIKNLTNEKDQLISEKSTLEKYAAENPGLESQANYKTQIELYSNKIKELDNTLLNISETSLTATPNDAKALFLNRYRKGIYSDIAKGHTVNERVITGTDWQSKSKFDYNNQLALLNQRQAFSAQQNDLDRRLRKQIELAKLTDSAKLLFGNYSDEELSSIANGLTSGSASIPMTNIPESISNEKPSVVVNSELTNIQADINSIMHTMYKDFIRNNDPELYHKIGNLWENNAIKLKEESVRKQVPGITKKQLELIANTNEWINKAANPLENIGIVDSPEFKQYAEQMDKIAELSIKRNAINSQVENAKQDAWKEYNRNNPNDQLDYNNFKQLIDSSSNTPREVPKDTPSYLSGFVGTGIGSSPTVFKNNNRVSLEYDNQLKKRGTIGFFKEISVDNNNKEWKSGSTKSNAIFAQMSKIGFVGADGKTYSINGMINDKKSENSSRNINLKSFDIIGFSPDKNYVTVQLEDNDKNKYSGIVKFDDPNTFRGITGFIPERDDQSLAINVKNAGWKYLSDSKGNIQYFNTLRQEVPELNLPVKFTLEARDDNNFNIWVQTVDSKGNTNLKQVRNTTAKNISHARNQIINHLLTIKRGLNNIDNKALLQGYYEALHKQ